MNVKELVDELSKYDDDLEVVYVSDLHYTGGEISYCEFSETVDGKDRIWLG